MQKHQKKDKEISGAARTAKGGKVCASPKASTCDDTRVFFGQVANVAKCAA
ncbi:MAG: hypothetical protein WBF88_08790 [Pusillimonas sp.]